MGRRIKTDYTELEETRVLNALAAWGYIAGGADEITVMVARGLARRTDPYGENATLTRAGTAHLRKIAKG